MFRVGQVVRFAYPPDEEFEGVTGVIVEVLNRQSELRVRIHEKFRQDDERLKRHKIYRYSMERFEVIRILNEKEKILLAELKNREHLSPVELLTLHNLEEIESE